MGHLHPDTTGFSAEEIAKAKHSGEIQLNVERADRHRRMIKLLEAYVGAPQAPGQQSIADRIRAHLREMERYERLVDIGRGWVEKR